jgi:hypothetical protein
MSRLARWTLALIVATLMLATSLGSAFATPRTPPNPPGRNAALEAAYRVAKQRLKVQDTRLIHADAYAARVDAVIARLKERRQDTAPLERAIAAFRSRMADARKEWQGAQAGLATHAGFDDQGKVTNADQARASLKGAHEHMEQATRIARAAYRDLHAAFVAYRRSHRGAEEPLPPATP